MDRISEESGVEKIVKTEEIFEYVQKQYGTVPEYLWSKLPTVQYFDIRMGNGMQ